MKSGLVAVLIILCIVIFATKTRKCVEALLAGSLIAAVILYRTHFIYRGKGEHTYEKSKSCCHTDGMYMEP